MANPQEFGLYVPSTYIWDVEQLHSIDVTSPEFKELLVRLYQNINAITIAINLKDSGYYFTDEFVCGQQYFQDPTLTSASQRNPEPRQIYRKVVNFGALPNTATKSVAHGLMINSSWNFTRIYGTATDTAALAAIPLPYSTTAAVGDNIELNIDAANVNVTTESNRTNFNQCYVVLEYFKF